MSHKQKRTNEVIYKALATFFTKSRSNIPQSIKPKIIIFEAVPVNDKQPGSIFIKQQKHDSTPIFLLINFH